MSRDARLSESKLSDIATVTNFSIPLVFHQNTGIIPSDDRHSMFGRRAFSVAGLAAWNSLPGYLWDPTHSFDSFRSDLKTFLFSLY